MSPNPLLGASASLVSVLGDIVGLKHLLLDPRSNRSFRTGYRFGGGPALGVVRPGSLVEMWRVLTACVAADVAIILQAANTGLTGGSTPMADGYDRPVIIINTMRIGGIHPIDEGRQVICLPGATLDALEKKLQPFGREPHSVIGSSCIGASVLGGICNNSGGALVRRGPAYTEMALFARIDDQGQLLLVNHLDIDLGEDPEQVLTRIEQGDFRASDIRYDVRKAASDREYERHVRDIESPTPARYNADPRRLFEAAGSAGKVALFAVRLDTFPREEGARVFYIGTNDPAELATIRREMLRDLSELPIAAEYMHRDAFDITAKYGKDTFLAVKILGTRRLPILYKIKARIDALVQGERGASRSFSDRLLQWLSGLLPDHLPVRLRQYRDAFEHHLLLRVSQNSVEETERYLTRRFPSASGDFLACSGPEGTAAFLHRFAAAGAAVRYRTMHPDTVEDIVALDFALPRNARDWCVDVAEEDRSLVLHDLRYGHFFCHVIHEDLIVARGADASAIEERAVARLERQSCECPAEHNVGHLYAAKPALAAFYADQDPTNRFNPGIGRMSRHRHYAKLESDREEQVARSISISP